MGFERKPGALYMCDVCKVAVIHVLPLVKTYICARHAVVGYLLTCLKLSSHKSIGDFS